MPSMPVLFHNHPLNLLTCLQVPSPNCLIARSVHCPVGNMGNRWFMSLRGHDLSQFICHGNMPRASGGHCCLRQHNWYVVNSFGCFRWAVCEVSLCGVSLTLRYCCVVLRVLGTVAAE